MPEPNVLRRQRKSLVCLDLTASREICEIGEVSTWRKHSRHSVAAVNMSTLTALLKAAAPFAPHSYRSHGKAIPLNSKQNERRSNFLRVIALERQLLICAK
jgi:hypothetical protein